MSNTGSSEQPTSMTGTEPHLETARLLERLVDHDEAEILYGDETEPEEDDAETAVSEPGSIGHRRMIERANSQSLEVVHLNEEGQRSTGAILQEEFGISPTGHVRAMVGSNHEQFAGLLATVHVGQQAVKATVEIWHDPEMPQADMAARSFETANRLGLGDVWTRSLLAYLGGADRHSEQTVTMGDPEVIKLNETLKQHLDNRPQAH